MGRIVFLNPFTRTEISGGIKTAYRHAELLTEMGFDACVYQPEGPPGWFETWADATLKSDPGGMARNPPVLRAPNGVVLDGQRYWGAPGGQAKMPYNAADIRVPTLLIKAEWDRPEAEFDTESVGDYFLKNVPAPEMKGA